MNRHVTSDTTWILKFFLFILSKTKKVHKTTVAGFYCCQVKKRVFELAVRRSPGS